MFVLPHRVLCVDNSRPGPPDRKARRTGRRIVKRFNNLNKYFQTSALMVRRLMRDDPEFRELCEDYEEAAAAMEFWSSPGRRSKARAEEYRALVRELAAEIELDLRKQTPMAAAEAHKLSLQGHANTRKKNGEIENEVF